MTENEYATIEAARDDLKAGRGVDIQIPVQVGIRRLLLIPSACYRGEGKTELLIALEGKGVFLWDGKTPLNEFKLVSAGFPLFIAQRVVTLVQDVMLAAVREMRSFNALNGAQFALTEHATESVTPIYESSNTPRRSSLHTPRTPRHKANGTSKASSHRPPASRLTACSAF